MKLPKQAVLYICAPEGDYDCDDCLFYKAADCLIFDEHVEAYGSCGLFLRGDSAVLDIGPLGVLTKEQAGYMESESGFSCKCCGNFLDGNDCKVVDKKSEGDTPGEIHPDACCNAWKPAVEQLTKDTPGNRKALRSMDPDEYRELVQIT